MAMKKQNYRNDCMILRTIEELVPKEHLVRRIDECISFKFIEEKVEHLYSKVGRNSIPPMVLFKLLIINKIFGINSMRKTCEECEVNAAYRWYLGLSFEDKIPNYSTWSKNYERRYKNSEIFEEIFEEVLKQAIEYGYIDVRAVFYDGTHQKAAANKRKCTDEEVKIEGKKYQKELLEEINKVRREHNQKEVKEVISEEIEFNEETGEEEKRIKTKHIKVSTIDPESGHYHKGEHEQCFAYTHNVGSDINGFVLGFETSPGNIHDSVSFEGVREKVNKKFKDEIIMETLDAGYKTPAICREIIEDNKIPLLPYTRSKGKKGEISKKDFIYDKEKDVYICPNNEELKYSTVNKEGYIIYKSNSEKCKKCPLKEQCIKSKTNQKSISRHVWQGYIDEVEEIRHSQLWKEYYPKRKETIERIFGECKENMCLRFTRVKGLKKNQINASIIFTCHNLKKMALWRWKYTHNNDLNHSFYEIIKKLFMKSQNKRQIDFLNTYLSTV